MSRTMYDAVTVANIPTTAEIIGAYVDGNYANYDAVKTRFPHAVIVPITVFATDDMGTVLDVEPGDATPLESVGWVKKRRAAGIDPTIYCDMSRWAAVKQAFNDANETEPHYWVADWTGTPHIPAGAIACQYSSPGPYDVSEVADYWPGIDLKPVTNTGGNTVTVATYSASFTIDGQGGGIHFARGIAKNAAFFCDNTLALGEANLGVDLRVVVWETGTCHIQTVRVSNKGAQETMVRFPNPDMTYAVTVTRADGNTIPVYAEVSG